MVAFLQNLYRRTDYSTCLSVDTLGLCGLSGNDCDNRDFQASRHYAVPKHMCAGPQAGVRVISDNFSPGKMYCWYLLVLREELGKDLFANLLRANGFFLSKDNTSPLDHDFVCQGCPDARNESKLLAPCDGKGKASGILCYKDKGRKYFCCKNCYHRALYRQKTRQYQDLVARKEKNEVLSKEEQEWLDKFEKQMERNKERQKKSQEQVAKEKKICNEPGCNGTVRARGWCQPCYNRNYHRNYRMEQKKAHPIKICKEAGCNEPVHGRGLCNTCYNRNRRMEQKKANPIKEKTCNEPGCNEPVHGRGWCNTCYNRNRRMEQKKANPIKEKTCNEPGCNEPVHGRGWCNTCYNRNRYIEQKKANPIKEKTCNEPWCNGTVHARGWCKSCYNRNRYIEQKKANPIKEKKICSRAQPSQHMTFGVSHHSTEKNLDPI